MQSFLFVGLGNLGSEYNFTRHNIGFDVLDFWASEQEFSFQIAKYGSLGTFSFRGRKIYALKPDTYMNLSGKAVRYHQQALKIPTENILIITDDLSLPLGKIRIKKKGSAGGHNGLKSVEEYLQTQEYPRLRFGIGNDFPKGKQADFVLSRWHTSEKELVNSTLLKSVEALESLIINGVEKTMSVFNAS